jgi:hypothetical protein
VTPGGSAAAPSTSAPSPSTLPKQSANMSSMTCALASCAQAIYVRKVSFARSRLFVQGLGWGGGIMLGSAASVLSELMGAEIQVARRSGCLRVPHDMQHYVSSWATCRSKCELISY